MTFSSCDAGLRGFHYLELDTPLDMSYRKALLPFSAFRVFHCKDALTFTSSPSREVPSHPSAFSTTSSDLHRDYLPRLCNVYRLPPPLDALLRSLSLRVFHLNPPMGLDAFRGFPLVTTDPASRPRSSPLALMSHFAHASMRPSTRYKSVSLSSPSRHCSFKQVVISRDPARLFCVCTLQILASTCLCTPHFRAPLAPTLDADAPPAFTCFFLPHSRTSRPLASSLYADAL